MNPLRDARRRLFEHRWYGGNFGRLKNADEYIADSLNRSNHAPPTRVRFCDRCGAEVRWYRETPGYSVTSGRPGHSYHLKCPHVHDFKYEMDRIPEGPSRAQLSVAYSEMHYDSHEYRWREDDRESFDGEDLW